MQITTESIQDQIPYYLTKEAKENLAKELNNFSEKTNYFTNRYQKEVLQGDGWLYLPVINPESGERKLIKGILISNSCDIDPENIRDLPIKVSFAPIIRLNQFEKLLLQEIAEPDRIKAKISSIKAQKITSLFYLPKGGKLEEEYVALLNDIHSIPYKKLIDEKDQSKLFTLNQIGFYIFLFKLSVHFCRFHENIDRS
ncbi:MAG: hypothetical protein RLZ75_1126 [Pseudomonadota bacterium]|jgi:hypothetical protein